MPESSESFQILLYLSIFKYKYNIVKLPRIYSTYLIDFAISAFHMFVYFRYLGLVSQTHLSLRLQWEKIDEKTALNFELQWSNKKRSQAENF